MTASGKGPAQPIYILRGHTSPVHALQFYNQNAFLVSGDTDGWVIVWDTTSKRPVVCWKAHEEGLLGVQAWGERIVTHGRDHKLCVWQLKKESLLEGVFDTRLPGDRGGGNAATRSTGLEPWLLHSLAVSALNFCAFSLCPLPKPRPHDGDEALFAVPNALDTGGIDIFHLPSEHRICVLKSDAVVKTGIAMTVDLTFQIESRTWTLISGYEDGHTLVHRCKRSEKAVGKWEWQKVLQSRPHAQPLLSLEPDSSSFYTSSADAIVAKFKLPVFGDDLDAKPAKINNTKHAGQQDLIVRSDGKIFATAGWDRKIRVYSAKTLTELAVLKWHQEGCCSLSFAQISTEIEGEGAEASSTAEQSSLQLIKHDRNVKAQQTHWLACGGKDGKISLWDIY